MKRFHALEWEDLTWFPRSWRNYGTDYLCFIANKFDIYKPIVPVLKRGIEASGQNIWVDCASGGGGGLLTLTKHLSKHNPELKVILTDYFPNHEAFELTKTSGGGIFEAEKESINAMSLPNRYHGKFRTLFGAFHHFKPEQARTILQNAVDTNSPIAIFEPVGRNFGSYFSMLFVIFNVLLLTPFIRPVRLSVLPFIYLLPLIPLYILWDGVASILRTYSEKELNELVATVRHSEKFDWEIGSKRNGPMPVYYLLGVPKKR